jgi:GDP-L-fucose synthase
MLGSAVAQACQNLRPTDELITVRRADVDLRDPAATKELVARAKPDVIVHAAAVVGGIAAKLAHPTPYLLDNLRIDTSVISAALESGVERLLYVGSAAMYPENYRQPFQEADILAGPLEPANEGYAVAKIAATKLCEYASTEFGLAYRVAIPSNLYGPGEDFSLATGHLIAAALAKVHAAKIAADPFVTVWGDGTARREFTFSGDLASWLVGQLDNLGAWPQIVNLGAGQDHSIREYYEMAARVVGYTGTLTFDTSKPAGMQQRILDSSLANNLGWRATTSISAGMARTYESMLSIQSRERETK